MRMATLGLAGLTLALVVVHGAPAENAPPAPGAAPLASPQTAPAQPANPGPIAALQQQLKEAGYAPGPVNGVMTDQTREATAIYERRTGRPPEALAAGGRGADPVRAAQGALQRLGLLRAPADGVVGPETRDAIIRFQASHHLAIDPRISDMLLAALQQAGGSAAGGALSPPAEAGAAPPGAPEASAATGATPPSPEATGRRPLPPGVNPPQIH